MTTPRIMGARPDTARNSAVKALLAQNPGSTVLVEEVPRTDENTQRGVSARLLSFKKRNPGVSVWTSSEDDGYVRGYAKLRQAPASPVQTLIENLEARIAEQTPAPRLEQSSITSVTEDKPKVNRSRKGAPRKGEISRSEAYVDRLRSRGGRWTSLSSRPNNSGVTTYTRQDPDQRNIEAKRVALLNYAKKRGLKVETKMARTVNSVRLVARLVEA